ncbi:hypothetical protein PIB30_000355 [Stylosanthes scabra]|uniref:Protein FAR1-RELATED SEQUENCE n=1 Tax=Stylosanthes scabra TaxID=79078 RepID=A0ABU6U186_9FABA|nr:hypothetical protein [Stylosanthes scabra]
MEARDFNFVLYLKSLLFGFFDRFLCNVDEEYIPKVGMTFVSCAEANDFYKEEGKRTCDIPEAEKTNPMSSANCPARMFVHIEKKTQLYVISKVVLEHSYSCSADVAEILPQHRELSMYIRQVIVNNDQAGIRPSKTYQSLVTSAGGHHGLNFIEKDVRN